jgi:hypothetical protein
MIVLASDRNMPATMMPTVDPAIAIKSETKVSCRLKVTGAEG